MLEHALANGRRIGIAHLRPGFEAEYEGCPRIFRMLSTARIVLDERLPDGRYNILVEGIERVEFVDEKVTDAGFRLARVRPQPDEFPESHRAEALAEANELARQAEAIGRLGIGGGGRLLQNMMNVYQHPGIVADVAAGVLVSDAYARQSILEATEVLRRVRLVAVQLQTLVARIASGDIEQTLRES